MTAAPTAADFRSEENISRHAASVRAIPSARRLALCHCLLLLAVALFETKMMWAPAMLAGHSDWFDLTRMVEFDQAIRAGDYLPAWSPDFYHGYGSPLFQFYSPLFYFLTELPVLAGVGISTALKLTLLVTLFASGLAMYYFAAAHVSRWAACFAAVLYVVAPYRIVDLFVRHATAEHAAFLWLPLLILGTERFCAQRSRAGLLLGMVSTAGLILTHNIMALIGLPVCVAAGWLLQARPQWRSLWRPGLPAALGVGLATFFWWPAWQGRIYTQAETSLTNHYFDYHNHFVEAWRLLDTGWGFGFSGMAGPGAMPLQIGWPHILVGVAALVLLFTKYRTRWVVIGLAFIAGALVLCSAFSRPIWENIPLLKYVQFPWRFLGFAILGASMCGAAALDLVKKRYPRMELPVFAAALIAVMTIYFPYYSQPRFVAASAQAHALVRTTADTVEAMQTADDLLPIENLVTPAAMRAAGECATSGDDFLPRGVAESPTQPPPYAVTSHLGIVRALDRLALSRYRATVAMESEGEVELHQFWFPGWKAKVDGAEVAAEPEGSAAVVSCAVPAGDHTVEFYYDGPPQRRAGLIVSGASMGLAAAAMFLLNKRPPREVT